MKSAVLFLAASTLFGAADAAKDKDMCSVPPGANPPSLPAKILTGQGSEYLQFRMTTSNPEAQKFFVQGVAQMHSFWAVEAERSFLQAAALDPEAPMPYWGIAMVAAGDYRPYHQLARDGVPAKQELKGGPLRASQAATKARELSERPGKATDLEKLYINSIHERRFAKDSDAAYIVALRNVIAAYPDEVEAPTYLALHLMSGFTLPDRKPRAGTMESVELLRALAVKFPDHPGVHHYIIHGFEGATFAKDAWPSCRRYPELVTNIPHALHMPGHIWAQTGKWDEAAKSFEDAAANELGYMKADSLYGTGHHGHNVQFLITTYMFQGKYEQAMAQANSLMAYGENPREAKEIENAYAVYRQGWFAALRTLVALEKWDVILDGKTLPVYDKPREQAWRHWALALASGNKGNLASAKKEYQAMEAALKDLAAKTAKPIPPVMLVASKELEGQMALFEHKTAKGLKLLQTAGSMERSLRYTEPPAYPRPVLDVLGDKALAAGHLDIAEAAYKDALDQYPEDPKALAGLEKTKKGL